MNIKVAHESPISIMSQIRDMTSYDYALVHLFETHPKYKQFFKESISKGREVLLDNSIFELGTAFDGDKFADVIQDLRPTYYIVPDVLENALETVQSFSKFVSKYPHLPGLKIGAVQGTSYHELVECYKYMSDCADYIAISFDYSYYLVTGIGTTQLQRWCNGRQSFIQDLIDDGIWNWKKPHHLLGCSLAKEFKYYVQENIYNIRSCDTSNPIVAGIKGLKYAGDLGLTTKPSTKLADLIDTEVTGDEWADIQYNVNAFKQIISR